MERNCIDMEIQKFINYYFDKRLTISFSKNDKGRFVDFTITNTPTPTPYHNSRMSISYDDIRIVNELFELRDMNNKRWLEFR